MELCGIKIDGIAGLNFHLEKRHVPIYWKAAIMVMHINSLCVFHVTDVYHHQYIAQIQVILRRLEATAPLLSRQPFHP